MRANTNAVLMVCIAIGAFTGMPVSPWSASSCSVAGSELTVLKWLPNHGQGVEIRDVLEPSSEMAPSDWAHTSRRKRVEMLISRRRQNDLDDQAWQTRLLPISLKLRGGGKGVRRGKVVRQDSESDWAHTSRRKRVEMLISRRRQNDLDDQAWQTRLLPISLKLRGGGKGVRRGKVVRQDSEMEEQEREGSQESLPSVHDSSSFGTSESEEDQEESEATKARREEMSDWRKILKRTVGGRADVREGTAAEPSENAEQSEHLDVDDEDIAYEFDRELLGGGFELSADGRTVRKAADVKMSGKELGYPPEMWYENGTMYGWTVPTHAVWAAEPQPASRETRRYHAYMNELEGGHLFVGMAELPMEPRHCRGYELKTKAWMLTDQGCVFRTGPDVGGPGYYDPPKYPRVHKVAAQEVGFETLTRKLKEELAATHPSVTTPGIWAFRSGGVVSMTHNISAQTLTFSVNSAPPFTLHNVSDAAVPFLNVFCVNDTVSLVTASEASELRRRFDLKRRNPEDPDYWLWDWERWRPWDGGFVEQEDGTWEVDESKPNRWLPDYDYTDGRSPVPGISVFEYNMRRAVLEEERREKRRRERERKGRRELERGFSSEGWHRGERREEATGEGSEGEGESGGGGYGEEAMQLMGGQEESESE